ncbi:hypothetical protein PAI11_41960 [Patulibacter medicamentivorans]|uniref:ASCH domain-containing protein n=1 Tax=Patulibacter medicamentivorans TaxID=1097667 RepID=H0EBG7_9ACTN|nr:hypothetical protein [Patulibacter medicamentivorans]EHN08979.1 hypothetical protein PAI11_41960 [Patulibacter medicamentivorans]
MLLQRAILDAIVRGEVSVQFRRWTRPSVKVGTVLRTAVGELEVESLRTVALERITKADARRAGTTVEDLQGWLSRREGTVYRIGLRYLQPDRRVALREDDALDDAAVRELAARLDGIDARSKRGPWTREVLRLIEARPAELAAELAASLGREKLPFKADVRRLKELGLTESLEIGYRLSPRGRAFLEREPAVGGPPSPIA